MSNTMQAGRLVPFFSSAFVPADRNQAARFDRGPVRHLLPGKEGVDASRARAAKGIYTKE